MLSGSFLEFVLGCSFRDAACDVGAPEPPGLLLRVVVCGSPRLLSALVPLVPHLPLLVEAPTPRQVLEVLDLDS